MLVLADPIVVDVAPGVPKDTANAVIEESSFGDVSSIMI